MKTVTAFILLFISCFVTMGHTQDILSPNPGAAVERDILDIAKERPLGTIVNGKPARYGDYDLGKAVDGLADIPHPWTVPKIAELFEKETTAWLLKLQHARKIKGEDMWNGWENKRKRCGYLATLLAASRDPRAALVLGKSLENPDSPGDIEAITGLLHYFVNDPRYHQLPADKDEPLASTNLIPIFDRMVRQWWKLNKEDLEASAKASSK
jgi:hypothetical protein